LLIAIRDVCNDEDQAADIEEGYLVNKRAGHGNYYKLVLGDHDRADLQHLIDGEQDKATGPVGSAYRWLRNAIEIEAMRDPGFSFRALERALTQRLEVVAITTTPADNAHRIFQTLNSTGKQLSQVDLLRNHYFMLLPTRTTEAYERLWRPMEALLVDRMDYFLWVDLVSRAGGRESTSRDAVYERYQRDLETIETDETAVYRSLRELTQRAESYARIIYPDRIADVTLRRKTKTLGEWGATAHHPILHKAFVLLDRGTLSPQDVTRVVEYIEGFLVRRMLTQTPTNNLNRIFTTTVAQVPNSTHFAEDLRRSLSTAGKYWPTDDELRTSVETVPFYKVQRPAQRQYVLRRLEEAIPGNEKPNWNACTYTLEHVMPQHLSDEWIDALREAGSNEPVATHAAYVHTLGNITLTCDNSSLSDSPIERKKQIFQNSMLRMNRRFENVTRWGADEIQERASELVEVAIKLWPGPVAVSTSDFEEAREIVRSALARMPEGRWTSLVELGDVADTTAEAVRAILVSGPRVAGVTRILLDDGRLDTSLPWVAEDLAGFRSTLVAEGVLDDSTTDQASTTRRITSEELLLLLSDA
jgi:hypothetical protein